MTEVTPGTPFGQAGNKEKVRKTETFVTSLQVFTLEKWNIEEEWKEKGSNKFSQKEAIF